jgi:hypothetical protein
VEHSPVISARREEFVLFAELAALRLRQRWSPTTASRSPTNSAPMQGRVPASVKVNGIDVPVNAAA